MREDIVALDWVWDETDGFEGHHHHGYREWLDRCGVQRVQYRGWESGTTALHKEIVKTRTWRRAGNRKDIL
jgi:hypothetical protein